MWEDIVKSYTDNPREVCSQPITKRPGRWFFVYVENGDLYVDCAKEHKPSSQLTKRRMLSTDAEKCNIIFDLYCRRNRGEQISAKATAITVNQIYWYGIFADMGY